MRRRARGHAAARRQSPNEGANSCWLAEFTPRKICGSKPSTRPKSVPARCCCGSAPAASADRTSTITSTARNGSFVVREPLIPGHEASATVAAVGPGRHARQGGRQGRGEPVACLRPVRLLPRRPRAALPEDALPRQRQPLPARAGHVQRVLRDGRAAVLSRCGRRHAGRARVRGAARGGAARGQARRRSRRQVGARSPAPARSAA